MLTFTAFFTFMCTECSLSWSPFHVHQMHGCSRQCCHNVHGVSALDILTYNAYFNQLPKPARRKWLLDYITTHSSVSSEKLPEISFFVCGKAVCQVIWIATLGISSSFFYRIRQKAFSGSISIVTEPQRSPLQKTSKAIAWIENYFALVGDKLPHRMVIHLPSNLTKVGIYKKMCQDFAHRNEPTNIVSQSNFFKIWNENFPQVLIPKVSHITHS